MNNLTVQVVELPPMRVASAYGFGKNPEGIATEKIGTFAHSKGIPIYESRSTFGFNNPSPAPGSPNYGYEIWLPVEDNIEPAGDIRITHFSGGLYAVTQFKNLHKIGETWKQLVIWREDSEYQSAYHQWLEELLTSPDVLVEEYIFKLYLPIAR